VTPGVVFSGAAPTTIAVALRINNVSVTPTFAGLSGAGLYQVNALVPAGITAGANTPVILTSAGYSSAAVTVAIQ